MTDPYRPFGATPAVFPRPRLERAGVPASAVDELEAAFPELPENERADLVRYVDGHSDDAIVERFGDGPPPAPVTRETLEGETVDDLEARIRRWNEAHPEEHLSTSGRKAELVGRLLDAYEGEQPEQQPEQPEPAPPPAAAAPAPAPEAGSTVATGTVPTAPAPTTPEGAPAGTQAAGTAGTAPAAPATGGTVTTGGTPRE